MAVSFAPDPRGSLASLTSLTSPRKEGGEGGTGRLLSRGIRRLSALLDSPRKLGAGAGPRRHSELSLGSLASLTSCGGRLGEAGLLTLAEEDGAKGGVARPVLRRNMPACWLDYRCTASPVRETVDLVTRLYSRLGTRHMVRFLLQFLTTRDLQAVRAVCRQWRRILQAELPSIKHN